MSQTFPYPPPCVQGGCKFGDGIKDTPLVKPWHDESCVPKDSCKQDACPDLVGNVMDYYYDDCMVGFTKEQHRVMNAAAKRRLKVAKEVAEAKAAAV